MHNSGTSLVANLLHCAGIPLGNRLLLRKSLPPDKRPRYDYFEDADVVSLQDQTLLALKRHWSSYQASFPLPDREHPVRQDFRHNLKRLIRRRLRGSRLWLVKDPRTAVLLEDWLAVLEALNVDAKLLIVHRDPAENSRSFSSKGRVPLLWAEALWQRTYIQALTAAGTLPCSQVHYCSFAALQIEPLVVTEQICRFLNWPVSAKRLQRASQRLNPSLPTHTRPPLDDCTAGRHRWSRHLQSLLESEHAGAPFAPDGALSLPEQILERERLRQPLPADLAERLNQTHSLNPKMSVTIVTAEFQGWGPSGGIGSAYFELARTLAEAGHPIRVLLVQPRGTEGMALKHVEVDWLDPSGLSRLQLQRRLMERLRSDAADVVHVHDWLGLASGLKDQLGPEPPFLIVGLHGPSRWVRTGNPWPMGPQGELNVAAEALMTEGLICALEDDGLAQADLVISPSAYLAAWAEQAQPVVASKLWVQRNCALRDRPLQVTADATAAEGAMGSEPRSSLAYFGRLEQRKGVLLFLDALEVMGKPPASVLFLGQDVLLPDGGSAARQVQDRLNKLNIEARVLSDCNRTEALAVLTRERPVVCIPSLIENSPCVVEELLGSGLRLVVTDVGGIPEMVKPEQRRWLSAPEPQALARHLEAALEATSPAPYRLQDAQDDWALALGWQALHEQLPRRTKP